VLAAAQCLAVSGKNLRVEMIKPRLVKLQRRCPPQGRGVIRRIDVDAVSQKEHLDQVLGSWRKAMWSV